MKELVNNMRTSFWLKWKLSQKIKKQLNVNLIKILWQKYLHKQNLLKQQGKTMTSHKSDICNGRDMPTEDVYFSGHLVLSQLALAYLFSVEYSFSDPCRVSGLSIPIIPRYWSTYYTNGHKKDTRYICKIKLT